MRLVASIVLISFLSVNIAFASEYDAECLNQKGKFSNCKVTVNDDNLLLHYKSKSEVDSDVEIPGNKIKSLSAGEYSRRRVAESVGTAVFTLGLGALVMFSKKKRDQIGIEYLNDQGKSKATMIQIKKKYGIALKTELKALSGKEIQEEVAKK